MTDIIQKKVTIQGRVQGVFFRMETKNAAEKLGVNGWVKNMPDGSVEALFQGDSDTIAKMLEWCHIGAPASRVDNVVSEDQETDTAFDNFQIRY